MFESLEDRSRLVICDLPKCAARRTVVRPSAGFYRWALDGRGIAYVETVGANLWVQPLDGSAPYQLTHFTDNRTITDFSWSRDGKRLAVARATFTIDIVLFKGLRP